MADVSLEPATKRMGDLVRGVPDDRLSARTPCDCSLGELLDHVQTLARAFANAAGKVNDETTSGPPPKPDAVRLGDDWRERIPQLLDGLASAWDEPAAWEGMTKVGGLDMPGEVAGVVALDEVVLHSWDVAVASGQRYDPPADLLPLLVPFLEHVAEPGMKDAREGLFGPVVATPDGAPLFDRILGLAGRDPNWTPA
jgi:uncharacterized protein (TIGR03086 family)